MYLLYPAANRDPGHFTDPDRFDPARPQSYGHASFGFGTHFCLGAGLARMEARALFAELLSRYRAIRPGRCPGSLSARAAERLGDPSRHPPPVITMRSEPSLDDLVRLEDPAFYLHPHDVYDRMRREQPAYYYAPLDIYVLTRYRRPARGGQAP